MIFIKLEYAMNAEKADDILAWLERDTQTVESFVGKNFGVDFYSKRKNNVIEVFSRAYELSPGTFLPKIWLNDEDIEIAFSFDVSRITEKRFLIIGKYADENIFIEKLFYTYLARLGSAFKAAWAEEASKTLEAIKAEIEKEEGGHWGWTDWRVDEKTGRKERLYGFIPNVPESIPPANVEQIAADYSKDETDFSTIVFDISASFEIPLAWDILVSASDSCLAGYAPGFVEYGVVKQLPASITYRLWQTDLGELGTVEIRKLGTGNAEIDISGVPMNSIDTAPMWLRVKPEWDKRINDALKGKRKSQEMEAYLAVSNELDQAKARIKAKQKDHQADVIKAYFNRLVHDLTLWTSNQVIPPPYLIALAGLTEWPDERNLSEESQEYFEKYKLEIGKLDTKQVDALQVNEDLLRLMPKGPKSKERFKKAWAIWNKMLREYKKDVLDQASDEAKPKIQDFRARVFKEINWQVSERHLQTVIRLGEAKLLK